jgi:flagellar protein FliO/FliZ
MTPGVDIADLSGVVMSLALVLTFIFGAAYVVRRTPFGNVGRRNGLLKIVAALPVGPKERLLIVQARDRELLIAVSQAGVFNLSAQNAGLGGVAAPQGEPQNPPVFTLGDHS